MDRVRKKQALEVLDYWKMMEFLGQKDVSSESAGNKKLIKKIENQEKVNATKIEIFEQIQNPYIKIEACLEQDKEKFQAFPACSDEICICLGKIERNFLVEYLEKYVENASDRPELAYPKGSAISWCSLKTDLEGVYVEGSFQLSPLLWAISVWNESRADRNHDFYLNIEAYDQIVEKFNEILSDQSVQSFLSELYTKIYKEYVKTIFPDIQHDYLGFMAYDRYKDENEKEKDESATDYADLGKSFFLNDLVCLSKLIQADLFGDHDDYEKRVMDYILSAYDKSKGMGDMKRTIISPKEPLHQMQTFFEKTLNVQKAPIGKWPAKFMPALMQQVAVNLAIEQEDATPIFSVNGPPGTGKTTLIKEIVANNIVERALLLAKNGDDPDTLFAKHSFKKGPLEANGNAYFKFAPNYYSIKNDKINDYGMLVASCNNAAVENITIDLPKAEDILDSLQSADKDPADVQTGLEEVLKMFDIEKSDDIETITRYGKSKEEKDIFYTRYANNLLGVKNCWGLVSAPFGKRANIRKYCNTVLKPFIEEYKSNEIKEKHRKKFVEQKKIFLEQYEKVLKLRDELEYLCSHSDQAAKLIQENYAQGAKKLDPIDQTFMEMYTSKDPKASTDAQVMNPWFTAQYNREREKLFYYACKVHKEFTASSKCLRQNLINLMIGWNCFDDCGERMQAEDRAAAMPYLLQTIFLLTPVISTTFAAAQTFLSDIGSGRMLGTLIVDESGQAQPQMSVGAMFRCRKSIIVGDPKQIEPVVTAEADMIKQLLSSKLLSCYKDKTISVQGFADYINPFGTFLGEGEESEWVGCPLVVHRRCIDPMYTISNVLSYDGTMKQKTGAPNAKREASFIMKKSCWIQVSGKENAGAKDHFVKAQGEIILKLLQKKFMKTEEGLPKLFIITPFTTVKNGMIKMIEQSDLYRTEPRVKQWLAGTSIGTVHTFQGQGTDEVIFLLGCDQTSVSAANWVNKNIVNVAATRAKFRFYMIGDEAVWTCKPVKVARECTDYTITIEQLEKLLSDEKAASDDEKEETASKNLKECPRCKKPLILRHGKFGDFLGCSGFPKCKYTSSISKKTEK